MNSGLMDSERMNSGPGGDKPQQRSRLLVDKSQQGRLLLALVVLETTLLIVAVVYLYQRFSALIDANLVTLHRTTQTALLPELLHQLGWVLLVMGVVNTLALFAAHGLWTRHLSAVIRDFRRRLERIGSLDLRPLKPDTNVSHEVLDALEAWREQEQKRLQQVAVLVAAISLEAPPLRAHRVQLRQQLLSLKRLLKPAPVPSNGNSEGEGYERL